MDITKITQGTIKLAENAINQGAKVTNKAPKAIENPEKLMGSLDCLATNAIFSVKPTKKVNLPEFIYHITSQENFEKILQDKKIVKSSFEVGQNGCCGTYLVDRDNFLQKWLGRQEPSLFGDADIGGMLMMWTSKGSDPVAIKIPTSSLDLSKLRFRPYVKACLETAEKLDPETLKVDSKLVTEGLPLSDLAKYVGSNEPIEFVYTDEIPADLFNSFSTTRFTENMRDMIDGLFS